MGEAGSQEVGRLGTEVVVRVLEERKKPEPGLAVTERRVEQSQGGSGGATVGMRRSQGARTAQWLCEWVRGKPGRGTGLGAAEVLLPSAGCDEFRAMREIQPGLRVPMSERPFRWWI